MTTAALFVLLFVLMFLGMPVAIAPEETRMTSAPRP